MKAEITLRQTQGDAERSRSITKEMTVGEVIKKYPRTAFLFIDYELHCVGCPIAQGETIEQAAKAHRLDLKKISKI